MPLVSIIMPTYNRAGYILETIQSIISQSYAQWELLVIDDGSTDNTEELVQSVQDARIQYYKFPRTGITGKLKNFGIREARGELLAFMDSDDLWPVDKLEKQVNALLQHPEARFSFTNGFNFTTPYKPEEYFYNRLDGVSVEHVFNKLCNTDIGIRTPTLLLKRECLDKTGFFKETRVFTDYSFIAELCYYFNAVILYEPLFYRRLHPGNNFNANSYEDYVEYFETVNRFIASGRLSPTVVKSAMFKSHIHAGDVMLLTKDKRKAGSHYLLAWKYNIFSLTPLKRYIKMYLRINT